MNGLDKTKNENTKRENEEQDDLESNKKAKIIDSEEFEGDSSEDERDSDEDQEENDSLSNDKECSVEDQELDIGEHHHHAQDNSPLDDDGDEQPLQNPIILLNSDGFAMGMFTPVSELMEELSRMKLRSSKLLPVKE